MDLIATPAQIGRLARGRVAAQEPAENRRPRVRWVPLFVFALLGLYAVLSWTASLNKGQSFDEGLQLAVGYNIWLNDDFRMEGANGDFVKRWATLPYLITNPNFPTKTDPFWKQGGAYEVAHRFFFQLGNMPELLLAQSRAMVVLLGVATGLIVYIWARQLFGFAGGFISLCLFVFSPHMLAFGGVVSTDMSITFALLAATACIWRLLHKITIGWLFTSLATFGLLVLAKPSALVILPITVALVALKLIVNRAMQIEWRNQRWILRGRSPQAAVILVMVCMHAAAGVGAIWSHYSFRYRASAESDPSIKIYSADYRDGMAAPLRSALHWLRENHWLPEGFHRGVHHLASTDDETVSFLNGKWTIGGQRYFFPYAIWAKTSLTLVVLLIASGGVLAIYFPFHRKIRPDAKVTKRVRSAIYSVAPLIALITCYLGVALFEELNIGHRHVLPIYPAIHILTGAIGLLWVARASLWKRVFITIVVCGSAAESFGIRPDYLAYFGPQVGGPDNGFKHLVDSSIDWGMDLPALNNLLAQHNSTRDPVFLAYFGTDSPRYHGINAHRLPGFFDRRPVSTYPLEPGYYAISATLLQSLYTGAVGPWSKAYEARYKASLSIMTDLDLAMKGNHRSEALQAIQSHADDWAREIHVYDALRFGRLCAWLRNSREPDFRAGYSILVWKLTREDIRAALLGPPAELTNDPLPARQYGRFAQVR